MTTELQRKEENVVNSDEFKGKKVIDKEGIEYGKVKHVQIHCDTLQVIGITVHEGFHKDYFLPRDHIARRGANNPPSDRDPENPREERRHDLGRHCAHVVTPPRGACR